MCQCIAGPSRRCSGRWLFICAKVPGDSEGLNLMCGICGQVKIASDEPVDQNTIRRMSRTMFHRGPDDEGYFFDRSLGFGFRRLSIIDLSGGHQPMSDVEESVWIAFNGEIYNYKELRA